MNRRDAEALVNAYKAHADAVDRLVAINGFKPRSSPGVASVEGTNINSMPDKISVPMDSVAVLGFARAYWEKQVAACERKIRGLGGVL